MVNRADNELITLVEGDAPLGRLMRVELLDALLVVGESGRGDAPTLVRLFGENYVAFRAPDGRIGFLDELCPHRRGVAHARPRRGRRPALHESRMEDRRVRSRVVEAPTEVVRTEQFCAAVRVDHFPVHETGGIAWVWLGGDETPPFPDLPFNDEHGLSMVMTISLVPANWLQGLEGGIDSVHAAILHRSVIEAMLEERGQSSDTAGVRATFAAPPTYQTEEVPTGLRQASLRAAYEERTYDVPPTTSSRSWSWCRMATPAPPTCSALPPPCFSYFAWSDRGVETLERGQRVLVFADSDSESALFAQFDALLFIAHESDQEWLFASDLAQPEDGCVSHPFELGSLNRVLQHACHARIIVKRERHYAVFGNLQRLIGRR